MTIEHRPHGSATSASLFSVAVLLVLSFGCSASSDSAADRGIAPEAITALLSKSANARPLALNHHALTLNWGITKSQEQGCGAQAIAGGDLGGNAEFTHLGNSTVSVSAAWDIGHLITGSARFTPVGPASGPVAPILGRNAYPYAFHYDPSTSSCKPGHTATGRVTLVAANGDRVTGDITGGETHKLDFLIDGDGIENFATIDVTGGTGRFADATGSFVVHTIARLQPTLKFAVTFAEILPGGTVNY
jgi:hypothetical protein